MTPEYNENYIKKYLRVPLMSFSRATSGYSGEYCLIYSKIIFWNIMVIKDMIIDSRKDMGGNQVHP